MATRGLWQIQQMKDLIAGCHSIHGNVEEGAKLTHGNEEICCQQDNQQTAP